jgi:Arc/MetJ family transcription regulator
MRTTLDLDPELLEEAQRELNLKSKKAVIEEALRELLAARRRQQAIDVIGTFEIDLTDEDLRKLRGK